MRSKQQAENGREKGGLQGHHAQQHSWRSIKTKGSSGRHETCEKIGWLIWPQTAAGPVNFLHIPRRILLEFVFGAVSAVSYLDSYLLLSLLISFDSLLLGCSSLCLLFRFVFAISF